MQRDRILGAYSVFLSAEQWYRSFTVLGYCSLVSLWKIGGVLPAERKKCGVRSKATIKYFSVSYEILEIFLLIE